MRVMFFWTEVVREGPAAGNETEIRACFSCAMLAAKTGREVIAKTVSEDEPTWCDNPHHGEGIFL